MQYTMLGNRVRSVLRKTVLALALGACTAPSASAATAIDIAAKEQDVTVYGAGENDHLTNAEVYRGALASGDLNDDGIGDLILGASYGKGPAESRVGAGEAYVFFGPFSSPSEFDLKDTLPDILIYGGDERDSLALGLAVADVNGDSIDDLIVGIPGSDGPANARADCGEIGIFFGPLSPGIIDLNTMSADATIYGDLAPDGSGDELGASIATGDFSGDGKPDVALGVPAQGNVYTIFGPFTPGVRDLRSNPADVILRNGLPGSFGAALSVGDVSGDGKEDLVIGSPNDSVSVLFGPISPGVTEYWRVVDVSVISPSGWAIGDYFGIDPLAKDISGDGIADLILPAPGPAGRGYTGVVYALFGPFSSGTEINLDVAPADITVEGGDADDMLGLTVTAGDATGNGSNDLFVGAIYAEGPDDSRKNAGEAYLFFGPFTRGTLLDVKKAPLTVYGRARGSLGKSLAISDVTGDGIGDLLIGAYHAAPYDEWDRDFAGEAYVLFGQPVCREPLSEVSRLHVRRANSGKQDLEILFDDSAVGRSAGHVNTYRGSIDSFTRQSYSHGRAPGGCHITLSPYRDAGAAVSGTGSFYYLAANACGGLSGDIVGSLGRRSDGTERPKAGEIPAGECP